MHVAAGDPEDFPPRVRPWLKVMIRNFSSRAHKRQFKLPELGEQVSYQDVSWAKLSGIPLHYCLLPQLVKIASSRPF
jgi:hypothetical protein